MPKFVGLVFFESNIQEEIVSFINERMLLSKLLTAPGQPIVKCDMNADGRSAVMEFRTGRYLFQYVILLINHAVSSEF